MSLGKNWLDKYDQSSIYFETVSGMLMQIHTLVIDTIPKTVILNH